MIRYFAREWRCKMGRRSGMAGLIRDNSSQGNTGLPFLKDIPLLGTLFSTQSNSRMRAELLVLITPHVVRDQRDARALTEDLRSQLINAGLVPQQASAHSAARDPPIQTDCNPVLTGPPRSPSARRNAGFALLIVLWTLVLIAFLVLHLTASGRTEIRIANNLQSNAIAAAAADGAISAAIFALSAPQPDQRWPVNGPAHQLTIGNCQVVVRLENEAARINPSLASPALMESLLRAVGSPPDNARSDRRSDRRLGRILADA